MRKMVKTHNDRIQIRIPGKLKQRLYELAKRQRMTVSDLLRMSIERMLEAEK
jgi:predicted DNA-binding protein